MPKIIKSNEIKKAIDTRYRKMWPWERYTCYRLRKQFNKTVLDQKGIGPFRVYIDYEWCGDDAHARRFECFINDIEKHGYNVVYDNRANINKLGYDDRWSCRVVIFDIVKEEKLLLNDSKKEIIEEKKVLVEKLNTLTIEEINSKHQIEKQEIEQPEQSQQIETQPIEEQKEEKEENERNTI